MPFFGLLKPNIEKLKEKRDIAGLMKATADPGDPGKAAAEALAALGTSTIPSLVAGLRSADDNVRIRASYALTILAKSNPSDVRSSASQPLADVLNDRHAFVRYNACCALGRACDEDALEALLDAFGDPDDDTRMEATWAVTEIFKTVKDSPYRARAVSLFTQALKDSNDTVRQNGSYGLGQVFEALDDPALASMALIPLMACAGDRFDMVRINTIESLGYVARAAGDESLRATAIDFLIARLADADPRLRRSGANALGKLRDDRAVMPLLVSLGDADGQTRVKASWALTEIFDAAKDSPHRASAVMPFVAALKDTEEVVRQNAVYGLEHIFMTLDDPALAETASLPLVASMRDSFNKARINAAGALGVVAGRVKDDRRRSMMVDALIAGLGDSDGSVRQLCCTSLGSIGDAKAADALMVALHDPEQYVRKKAAIALGQIGDKRAVSQLLLARDDKVDFVRQAALEALDKLGWKPTDAPATVTAASKDMAGIIKEKGLRPLGNKKRLVPSEKGCLDYRAQFRDSASALRYYEAFVKYAGRNPPPVLIEVMAAFTPNTIYAEKYSFILPYFNVGVREDYQKWAKEAILSCNDVLRQHSYCSGNKYEYVPESISSAGSVLRWAILPPKGFDPDSPEAKELLSDPPEMGYKAVKGEGGDVPEKPDPRGPWVGVLFDISKFEEAWYGRAATKQLMDIVGVQQLAGCVIHGGDLLPDARLWCNAIHAASQEQASLIDAAVKKSSNEKLARDRATVIHGSEVPVNTLPFQGFVSKEGVYVGN